MRSTRIFIPHGDTCQDSAEKLVEILKRIHHAYLTLFWRLGWEVLYFEVFRVKKYIFGIGYAINPMFSYHLFIFYYLIILHFNPTNIRKNVLYKVCIDSVKR